MKPSYEHLMSPKRLGRHLIKNRIIAAPVTIHSASNGESYPTEAAMAFFIQRAKAGAGIVVCAGAKLLPVTDDGEHASWDLYKHNSMNRLAELAEAIHFYGAKASMELIGIFEEGYVPSEGGHLMDGITPGREIPISEMEKYKAGYVHCAKTLMELGFDGILLHFGHSIPIAQFLSPLTNKRTDQYGGNFENRVRYFVEILEAIRAVVGDKMFIDIRMSADEFKEGGIGLEEGIKIAEVFQNYADIIQASCGMVTPELMCRTHPCDFLPPNPNVYLAASFKTSGRIHKNVCAIGGIGSLQDADALIGSGKADFVAMSRALIADPDLIPKSLAGRERDVVPCVKCMRCHDTAVFGHLFQCTVNPTIGLLHRLGELQTEVSTLKKVAVIGGGPAGMCAALTASKRGHQVDLYEASDALGGTLKFASKVPFKYSLAAYRDYLIDQVVLSDTCLHLGEVASSETLEAKGYDLIVSAVGAKSLIPSIAGVEHGVVATDVYGREMEIRKTVAVIGGGQVGCETALHLSKLGKEVHLIERQSELAPDASITHRGDLLHEMSLENELVIVTSALCTEIGENQISYVKDQLTYTLQVDMVVLAVGMQAQVELSDSLMVKGTPFVSIGDCVSPRTALEATKEGYFACATL